MKTFAFACLLAVQASAAAEGDWGYLTIGADWGAQCATGKNQSPINLKSAAQKEDRGLYVKAENFTNADGFRTYIAGTKKGAKPRSAIYLERDAHPDGEVDEKHVIENTQCIAAAKDEKKLAALKKKGISCLKFNGNAQMKLNLPGNDKKNREGVYEPLQIHFHAPSEHQVDGKNLPIEMHIVHLPTPDTAAWQKKAQAANKESTKKGEFNFSNPGTLAVLGVFFEEANCEKSADKAKCEAALKITEDFFAKMQLTKLFKGRTWATTSPVELLDEDMMPLGDLVKQLDQNNFWSYNGSLTTPPCSEGVKWTVLQKPMPVSKAVIKIFDDQYKNNQAFAKGQGNNRKVMPYNGRDVILQTFASSLVLGTASVMLASALF